MVWTCCPAYRMPRAHTAITSSTLRRFRSPFRLMTTWTPCLGVRRPCRRPTANPNQNPHRFAAMQAGVPCTRARRPPRPAVRPSCCLRLRRTVTSMRTHRPCRDRSPRPLRHCRLDRVRCPLHPFRTCHGERVHPNRATNRTNGGVNNVVGSCGDGPSSPCRPLPWRQGLLTCPVAACPRRQLRARRPCPTTRTLSIGLLCPPRAITTATRTTMSSGDPLLRACRAVRVRRPCCTPPRHHLCLKTMSLYPCLRPVHGVADTTTLITMVRAVGTVMNTLTAAPQTRTGGSRMVRRRHHLALDGGHWIHDPMHLLGIAHEWTIE
eukprot:m.48820 g.48820  ORF g.48820 m.48820 type:complete len:322 (+) comp7043_c0_seq1:537-1502(+)